MRDFRGLITNSGHTNGDICNAPGHFRDQISGNEVTMVNAMTLDWIIPLATPTGDDRFDRKSGGFDGAGGFCDFCRVDKAFGGHGAAGQDCHNGDDDGQFDEAKAFTCADDVSPWWWAGFLC